MADMIDAVIKVGEVPPKLRAGIDAEVRVVVSVRPLSENGFSEAIEVGVLDAERATEAAPSKPVAVALGELTAIASDESWVLDDFSLPLSRDSRAR